MEIGVYVYTEVTGLEYRYIDITTNWQNCGCRMKDEEKKKKEELKAEEKKKKEEKKATYENKVWYSYVASGEL